MNLDYFYVISLNDTQELRDRSSRVELPQESSNYEIKKGFHYQDLTLEELEKYGVNKHPNWKIETENNLWNREVTDGELGCSLSHVDVWIDAYCQDRDVTMVLEEDFDQQLPVPWEQVNGLFGS